jgi:2,3-bisphosphoglycerate-independent phosphoglycerate mutase
MKYVVLLGDGMADDPQEELSGRTPLEAAQTPNMDRLADCGEIGLARTVPEGMDPGSDVANMSILGYEPDRYYTGRAAIEAAALGITLEPGEAAFRCNLVTLGGKGADRTMDDYSGGHPDPDEQKAVINTLNRELGSDSIRFIPGVSFRNLCIISGFEGEPDLKPPHDYAGRKVTGLMPAGPGADAVTDIILKSQEIIKDLQVNKDRQNKGKPPISSVWFWGMGRQGSMPSFHQRHGLSSAVVTGVDLIRGLARMLDMEIIEVPGATGYVDTNFEGKAKAVLEALGRVDFVFLHVEAPDEAGHEGDLDLKIKAIEDFDKRSVGLILEGLKHLPECRMLLLPDHETPVKERGHRGGLVPYAVASSSDLKKPASGSKGFSEKAARESGGDPLDAPRILESRLFC